MRISVLGTGTVGRTLAARLAGLDHTVVMGTRDPDATLARSVPDASDDPPFAAWHAEHPSVRLLDLPRAGAHGDLLVNATAGTASVAALEAAGIGTRRGLVVLDVANALDFSAGFPPTLSVVNTDSLAEQIQRTFPAVRVVKALNTVNAAVMVDPARVPGRHHVFVAGDDPDAKRTVVGLLGELGWPPDRVVDLGGIRAARGTEMYLPLWLSMMQAFGHADFNVAVVRADDPPTAER